MHNARGAPRTEARLLVAAYGLLLAAWVGGLPFASGVDESAHYTKALGVASGQPQGTGRPGRAVAPRRWTDEQARTFRIPERLAAFQSDRCFRHDPRQSAACAAVRAPGRPRTTSSVGSYQPAPYVLPGLAARLAGSAPQSFAAARAANALLVWLLVGIGLALLASTVRTRVAGGVAALTPMVLFVGSHVQPNGIEIAAAFCFAAAALRIVDDDGRQDGGILAEGVSRGADPRSDRPAGATAWAAAAVSGMLTVSSRSLGAVWVLGIVLLVLIDRGPARAVRTLRAGGRWAAYAVAAVTCAALLALVWELRVQPRPTYDPAATVRAVPALIGELPDLIKQKVGVFGHIDVFLPWPGYAVWWVIVAALAVPAFTLARPRERIAMILLAGAVLAADVAIGAVLLRPAGWGSQGRYTLPAAVVVPVYAATVLARHERHLPRGGTRLLPAVALLGSGVHLVAWFVSARRYAVGVEGPWLFFRRAEWTPPGGWMVWTTLAVAGSAALAAAGAVAWRSEPRWTARRAVRSEVPA